MDTPNTTKATEERKKLTREEQQALVDYVIERTHHPLDDPEEAENIVLFWKRGTASSSEARLIETYLNLDAGLKIRFKFMFPALTTALQRAGYTQ
jgi:hypothetical protein